MLNRFFVSPDFSVYFRRAKQLALQNQANSVYSRREKQRAWKNQATSGYSLLTTLKGELNYTVDNKRETLESAESVLLEPNTTVSATGQQVDLLFLTFSASLVIQHGTTMRLIPPKSIVTFSNDPISDDQKLQQIL